jgi:hypothetical protein
MDNERLPGITIDTDNLDPQIVADLLVKQLNKLEPISHIESVTEITASGISSVITRYRPKPKNEAHAIWHASLLIPNGCLHDRSVDEIQTLLKQLDDKHRAENIMGRHTVTVTEFEKPSFISNLFRTTTSHIGTKNIIFLYHNYRSRPQ